MSRKYNRYVKLRSVFSKVQDFITQGYRVEWDGTNVTQVKFYDNEICLDHGDNCVTSIASSDTDVQDLADMKVVDIKKELQERLVISKVVSISSIY